MILGNQMDISWGNRAPMEIQMGLDRSIAVELQVKLPTNARHPVMREVWAEVGMATTGEVCNRVITSMVNNMDI